MSLLFSKVRYMPSDLRIRSVRLSKARNYPPRYNQTLQNIAPCPIRVR
jgi:hypothetical protein